MACRKCGSSKLQRSRRRDEWEFILAVFGFVPVRCTVCLDRKFRFALFLPKDMTPAVKTDR
ncbi:MAG: hypothetical protein SFV51_03390 [Bryobacteraceae bacterium]|nr:hypothetical protein [Bryobacteraceae bacterium]